MTYRVTRIYKSAIKNDEFLAAIKEADNDVKPGFFSHDVEKHFFAATYYGWLVGKYGHNWELHL